MKAWLSGVVFPSLFAHQGGWDEILLIVGPLAVVGGALWVANRRAAQLESAESGSDDKS